ncbi:FliH/SctL family protein [Paenibacillus qinlingensis]|uniref:Flagellar assembly protein FliH n=1 Tax=Paenibacillus qinlingensis TaxID=1837343 RepID=A0ABU1NZC5_9BACL|nr:FliH/SctL family protein [Paenibacillus qinlingensis]MDR6552820.1 flagellar assembly protein FliH [Paenibacillus qinlingensis]
MSNVIKSFAYYPIEDKKIVETLSLPKLDAQTSIDDGWTEEMHLEIKDATSLKNQILEDAEAFASEQIEEAKRECALIRQQTELDIAEWWESKRVEDEELINVSKQAGFDEGYREGAAQAEEALRKQYNEMLVEASSILEQSYKLKQQIIQESEPFLIELSTSIAEKIILRQLTLEPEWVIELIQKVLSRRREKGIITLCVAPSQFSYIQDAREELITSIDSQAELEIIPDSSVQDQGCVIRSSYGSIDARIDTQLKEIKSALQQLAIQSEES